MRILAIESSCDETAAAVVVDGRKIESNVVSSQIDVHQATGGVVPEVAARLQLETIVPVVEQALTKAKASWKKIDAIAVTYGPGLPGSLIVGLETAKALALANDKPLIPVNHLAGHLYACLKDEQPFRFPYVGVIVSGGHTEFVVMSGHDQFEVVGSTRDDAAGEAFDKVGKLLGLPYPGGPAISELAQRGNPKAIDFPRPMLDQPNLDVSFSGLKTDVLREVSGQRLTAKRKADLAASFQAAVVDTLVTKTLRGVRQFKPHTVLLGGGVAANPLLRQQLAAKLKAEKVRLLTSPPGLSTDNAAMIGLAAYWQAKQRQPLKDPERLSIDVDPAAGLASRAGSSAPA